MASDSRWMIAGVLIAAGAACSGAGIHRQADSACSVAHAVAELAAKTMSEEEARVCSDLCSNDNQDGCVGLAVLEARGRVTDDANVRKALGLLNKACEHGHAGGCGILGLLYAEGVDGPPDPARDAGLFSKACTGGFAFGCYKLGVYHRGLGDASQARELWQKACQGDWILACRDLAELYCEEGGSFRNVDQAATLFDKACNRGDPRACSELGLLHSGAAGGSRCGSDFAGDPARAAQLQEMACHDGYAGGCAHLGFLYEIGLGVPADESRAAALYRRAVRTQASLSSPFEALGDRFRFLEAECKKALADRALAKKDQRRDAMFPCVQLGVTFARGFGVAMDASKAADLFKRACEAGETRGCYKLARAQELGEGVSQNLYLSRQTYEKACKQDNVNACIVAAQYKNGRELLDTYEKYCNESHAAACINLADKLERDAEKLKDRTAALSAEKRAVTLYQKACDLKKGEGCSRLGLRHMQGRGGLSQDAARGLLLILQGCEWGSTTGCYEAGRYYEDGAHVAADPKKAEDFYDTACELGNAASCDKLGGMLTEAARHAQAKKAYDRGCALRQGKGPKCKKDPKKNR